MLRIATRRSALARAQAFQTGRLITEHTGAEFALVPMATTGDLSPERAIGAFDTKGLFVDTIRRALLDGEVELAVHSYKDLPSDEVAGLVVGAVPAREDPRDVLVTRRGHGLATLPAIATVGTSSERRRVQLLRSKPGLQVLPVRGNLDTRLRKVADGELDAVVVAFAGLRRLYVPEEAGGVGALGLPLRAVALEPGEVLSAPAQGTLAVECRADDADALAICRQIDDEAAHRAVRAERAFLARLGGGCLAPVGALATLTGLGALELLGMLADPVRRRVLRLSDTGPYDQPERLGESLADQAVAAGGAAMLESIEATRRSAPGTHP
ncbi:MAG TPA: hydroxymethylbilane synthase [Egibacteraceae bacterium]|nr:hydroxymethylbilane synthase [Egibacteraceae bacterium]